MKKVQLIAGISIIVGVAICQPLTVQAEEENKSASITTEGSAGFVTDGGAEIPVVKPGEDNQIKPESPLDNQPRVDNVVLTYAPKFNFGTKNVIALSNGVQEYEVKNDAYKNEADKLVEMPQFVQVADASGEIGKKWEVSVQQQDYFKTITDDEKKTVLSSLEGTRIRLYGQTLTNNVRAGYISGFTTNTDGYLAVPVKTATGENPTVILKSEPGTTPTMATSTNGTKSSVVFKNGYSADDYKTETSATSIDGRGTNAGVKLAIPNGDTVLAKNYTATLQWTLTITP